jgi:hypothetical protein
MIFILVLAITVFIAAFEFQRIGQCVPPQPTLDGKEKTKK